MFTNNHFAEAMWRQFGAAIDMLERAIVACPDTAWSGPTEFWYRSYHTIFYLDYYLTLEPALFAPPVPFGLSEFVQGEMPGRLYSREELLSYVEYTRNKCYALLQNFTDEKAESRFINKAKNYSMVEMLIYNLRHVQHHVGQLNLLLRQEANEAPGWISEAGKPFDK